MYYFIRKFRTKIKYIYILTKELFLKTFQIKCELENPNDLEFLKHCSDEFCNYYNAMLNVVKDDFELKKDLVVKNYLSKYDLQKQFSVKELGLKLSYLMSYQIQGISDMLFNSIKGFYKHRKFDKSSKFPKRYKNIKFYHPLYFSFTMYTIKILNDSEIQLSFQNKKKIKIKCKYNSNKFKLTTLSIREEGHKLIYNIQQKCFYFHFCINLVPKQKDSINRKSIFIDLGQKNLVTGYVPETNSIVSVSGKQLKSPQLTKRKETIQSLLDHKKKFSRKWKHLNKTLRRLRRKETNKKRTFLHKVSKKLVVNYETIVVGDLKGIKKQTISNIKNINKYKDQFWPISLFVDMLSYKSNNFSGNRFYKINERNTTKKCCSCNNIQEVALSERIYNCKKCGISIDRDTNSAINIYYNFLQLELKLFETLQNVSIETLSTSVLEVN